MTDMELMLKAIEARKQSYSPYSNFKVGAALLSKDGRLYVGCNIENASYTPTICAERVAFFKAVSEGVTEFAKIAIAGGKEGELSDMCPPCGVCRQVMSEFCSDDFQIVLGNDKIVKSYSLKEILPFSFTKKEL